MRRLVFSVIVASGLVVIGPSSAFADDPAPPVSANTTPAKKVCKVTDAKLDEVSGIVATETGFIVIDDSSDDPSHKRVFFLNAKCKIVDEKLYSGRGPRDTEDLILSPDGKTLWIADIGDNNYAKTDGTRRPTIGVWTMPVDGSKKPKIHRLSYPQGDYHDAEALLLNGDGTPLIVTKEIGRPAYIYQPTGPLQTDNEKAVPLKRVGQITVAATDTSGNSYARIGNRTIAGGAIAPGGDRVVLRTYTDALEWDVTGGDVLGALQKKPRTTGLPNEPLGEAITYSPDGKTFYTVSDLNGDDAAVNYVQQYTPATTVAVAKKDSAGGSSPGATKAWYADLSLNEIMSLVGGVGVLGLILVSIGIVGIVRFRKRPPYESDARGVGGFDNPLDGEPETELIGVGGAPPRPGAGLYGGSGPAGGGAAGVYGAASPGSGQRGGYGGGPGSGQQYGRPSPGAQPRGGQPARGGQPGRDGQPGRNGVYGAPPSGGPPGYGAPGRGQDQRPAGPGSAGPVPGPPHRPAGPAQRPQGPGQRPAGVYGQTPAHPDGGRPQRGGDDYNGRPDGRYDNPGYGRR